MKIYQLLMGRDIATDLSNPVHSMAGSMANFAYVVEYDIKEKKCILVDAAWDVEGILDFVKQNKLKVTHAIYTHRHLDHTGGSVRLRGGKVVVPGLAEVSELGIPIIVGAEDVEAIIQQTGIKTMRGVKDGEEVVKDIKVLHTPGHTPGSICILIENGESLITGDTLFIGSCGRVDLAESDPDAMNRSLNRLSRLPETCKVLPGHNYASLTQSTIGREQKTNFPMIESMGGRLSRNLLSATSIRTASLPDYMESAKKALQSEKFQ